MSKDCMLCNRLNKSNYGVWFRQNDEAVIRLFRARKQAMGYLWSESAFLSPRAIGGPNSSACKSGRCA